MLKTMQVIPYHDYPTMSALNVFEDPFFHHGLESSFGLGMHPSDFTSGRVMSRPHYMPHHLPTGYRRPWALVREAAHELAVDQKNMHFGKDGFQACVDVHHFKPNEITVKTVDHTVVIEGHHEERDDGHGSVTRHFMRKYVLPKEYDQHTIDSTLSSDGVLTVKAPPPVVESNERHVTIHHTGPAHLSIKDVKAQDDKIHNGNK